MATTSIPNTSIPPSPTITTSIISLSTASASSATPDATCTTAVPGKYGYVPPDACNSYYNYSPDYTSAVAVATIFAALTIAHLVLAIAFKKRYAWVIVMGGVWETVAFITGALGAHNQQSIAFATVHGILFLLAPLWINAFVYMSFSRMVYFFIPEKKMVIKATSMAKYFVTFDIFAFIVQAVGGTMASPGSGPSVIKTGINVYMAGIGIQEFFILCFVALMVLFQKRAIRLENTGELRRDIPWRPLLYALYGTLVAITVRIAYRIAEFAGGIKPSNPVPFHEAYSYALDAFPMMVALLLLAVFHPGRYLIGPESSFPRKTRAEKKAEKAAKKEAKAQKKRDKTDAKIELKTRKQELKDNKKIKESYQNHRDWDAERNVGMEIGVLGQSEESVSQPR